MITKVTAVEWEENLVSIKIGGRIRVWTDDAE